MKVTALALADDAQRYVRGYPPKGAWLRLYPNEEVLRLSGLAGRGDTFRYVDERVAVFAPTGDEDLVLAHVDLFQANRARTIAAAFPGLPLVLFGRQPMLWGDAPPDWAPSRVRGDPAAVWNELCSDARDRRLKPDYTALGTPRHLQPDPNLRISTALNSGQPALRFVRGCACPEPGRGVCSEWLVCGSERTARPIDEVIGEVLELPNKRIRLLDEDIALLPDYYSEVFGALWNLRREWTVNASDRLFAHPRLIRLLAKAGVRMVTFNDSLLIKRLPPAGIDRAAWRRLYRMVKSVQAARILVAARVPVEIGDSPADFDLTAQTLLRLDIDIIEPWFYRRSDSGAIEPVRVVYRPKISSADPTWLRDRFYSLSAIFDRAARRPRRVGFYSTALYLVPLSFAERQDFYEGICHT